MSYALVQDGFGVFGFGKTKLSAVRNANIGLSYDEKFHVANIVDADEQHFHGEMVFVQISDKCLSLLKKSGDPCSFDIDKFEGNDEH